MYNNQSHYYNNNTSSESNLLYSYDFPIAVACTTLVLFIAGIMFYCLCNKIYFHKTNEDNCKIDDEVDAALTRGGGLKWQSFDSYDIITFSDTNHKQCSCL